MTVLFYFHTFYIFYTFVFSGSDDARGPNLPQSVLGSRKDAPNVAGIYGLKKNISTLQDNPELLPIQEKSGVVSLLFILLFHLFRAIM